MSTVYDEVLHDDIWWVFKGPDTRAKFVQTMNRYPLYFHAAISAHFSALLLCLYRLYETRRDTHNVRHLLARLRKDGALSADVLDELELKYKGCGPIWKKVSLLRNEVFAQRSIERKTEESFAAAEVTPR